jgi:outer membrane protein assembly factor BamB
MNINDKIKIAKQTATVAGAFCIVISLLLLLNYLQMRSADPLDSEVMETIVQRLRMEPGNEQLKEEIRQFDLLARKAYFTSLWQVRTGGYLLLFASIILVGALRIYYSLIARIEKPEDEEETDDITGRALSRRWILAGTAILVAIALTATFTVSDPVERYLAGVTIAEEDEDQVERITISDAPQRPAGEQPPGAETEPAETPPGNEPGEDPDETPAETAAPVEARSAPVTPAFPGQTAIRNNHNALRGPMGNGVVYHNNLPMEWDGESGNSILWKVTIPLHAFSSPVIWEEKLFLTGADATERKVFCYDRHTGNLLWEASAGNIPGSPSTPPRTTPDTGLGAPSATTDGIGVYAIFGTGDIIALDMEGNRMWARNLGVPDNHYGHSSSLLSRGEKLFVQYDDLDRGRIICLNVLTGEFIWDITRDSQISWASPILVNVNGSYQLVVNGNPIVAGYDIETGRELWTVSAMAGEVGPSPVYGGGLVYAANEYATMVAINPELGEVVWKDNYFLPEVASPVYGNGYVFVATTYAVLACLDAETGEALWEYDTEDIFYSSPIIAGDRLYVTDINGNTYIFETGGEPNLLAQNSLGEKVYTTPAFAEGRIYIRGEDHLYCIGN